MKLHVLPRNVPAKLHKDYRPRDMNGKMVYNLHAFPRSERV